MKKAGWGMGMSTDRFAYEASRWSAGQPERRAERPGETSANRRRLRRLDCDRSTQLTIGFAQEWLAWHDRKREASEEKRHKKHWLDWAGRVVGVISMCIAGFTTYRTVLIQRDDIRVVVDGALTVRPNKGDLLLDRISSSHSSIRGTAPR